MMINYILYTIYRNIEKSDNSLMWVIIYFTILQKQVQRL